MEAPNTEMIWLARQAIRMTEAEAATLVDVTPRTWRNWESGAKKMPGTTFELFLRKTTEPKFSNWDEYRSLPREHGGIVVVFLGQTPIGAVSQSNFLNYEQTGNDEAIISYLVTDMILKIPTPKVHRIKFKISENDHVKRASEQWKSDIEKQPVEGSP